MPSQTFTSSGTLATTGKTNVTGYIISGGGQGGGGGGAGGGGGGGIYVPITITDLSVFNSDHLIHIAITAGLIEIGYELDNLLIVLPGQDGSGGSGGSGGQVDFNDTTWVGTTHAGGNGADSNAFDNGGGGGGAGGPTSAGGNANDTVGGTSGGGLAGAGGDGGSGSGANGANYGGGGAGKSDAGGATSGAGGAAYVSISWTTPAGGPTNTKTGIGMRIGI